MPLSDHDGWAAHAYRLDRSVTALYLHEYMTWAMDLESLLRDDPDDRREMDRTVFHQIGPQRSARTSTGRILGDTE